MAALTYLHVEPAWVKGDTGHMHSFSDQSTDASSWCGSSECNNGSEKHSLQCAAQSRHMDSKISQSSNQIIIFDWDDTLFPTWYLTEVVQPCLDHKYAKLPKDSIFYDSLAAHAQLVKQVLQVATSFAEVHIVTLSASPWVENSSDWFLPEIDLSSLMKELGIRTYYAREHVRFSDQLAASLEDGVHVHTIAKRNAMRKCLKISCWKSGMRQANVIAIGDSSAEMDAIRDVMWFEYDSDENRCKTIKFATDPSIQQLASELKTLQPWIGQLLASNKDFDFAIDDSVHWSSALSI